MDFNRLYKTKSATDGETVDEAEIVDPAKTLESIHADSPPETLRGFTEHGVLRFAERFPEIFGRPGTPQDAIDLLAAWNPAKAFINDHGRWVCRTRIRGIALSLVAENDELLTFYEK